MKRTRAFILLLALTLPAFAAMPTDISYSSKKSSMFSGEYHIYNVRCSDGKKQKISAWDKKRKWCSGTKNKECFSSQLKAASAVCR